MTYPVYLIPEINHQYDHNAVKSVNNLKSILGDGRYFDFRYAGYSDFPSGMSQDEVESAYLLNSVKDSKDQSDSTVLVVKNTSISVLNSENLYKAIKELEQIADKQNYDIIFLGSYLDRCQLYSDKQYLSSSGLALATTQGPDGFQAFIITRKGREKIVSLRSSWKGIRNEIDSDKLRAASVIPNIFAFNTLIATNNYDLYIKGSQCEVISEIGAAILPHTKGKVLKSKKLGRECEKKQPFTIGKLFIYILLFIIILLIIYVIYVLLVKKQTLNPFQGKI